MDTLSLRFPNHEHPDIPIGMGVHGVGRDPDHDRGIALVEPPHAPLVQFCVDRRGVWLNVPEGIRGVHVNGRPVLRMAMLRAGDTVHVEGIEVALAGAPVDRVLSHELAAMPVENDDQRVVLRGIGGPHHGRCFTLERPRTIGRLRESDIRIDDPTLAERHARVELHGDRVVLRDLGSVDGSVVNGDRVRDAVLAPGDQIVIDAHHRFVVEAPGMRNLDRDRRSNDELAISAGKQAFADDSRTPLKQSVRRLPLLLAAAALLGAALSALLWFTPT